MNSTRALPDTTPKPGPDGTSNSNVLVVDPSERVNVSPSEIAEPATAKNDRLMLCVNGKPSLSTNVARCPVSVTVLPLAATPKSIPWPRTAPATFCAIWSAVSATEYGMGTLLPLAPSPGSSNSKVTVRVPSETSNVFVSSPEVNVVVVTATVYTPRATGCGTTAMICAAKSSSK